MRCGLNATASPDGPHLYDVRGGTHLFHPRAVALTWSERHYRKPSATRVGEYRRKSVRRCGRQLPAQPYVAGMFRRATRNREPCGLSCKSCREPDYGRHPDRRSGCGSLTVLDLPYAAGEPWLHPRMISVWIAIRNSRSGQCTLPHQMIPYLPALHCRADSEGMFRQVVNPSS